MKQSILSKPYILENNILLHLIERAAPSNHLWVRKSMSSAALFRKIHYSTNVFSFFSYLRLFYNLVCVRCAYFCPTYVDGGVLSSIYGIDSICLFYYQFLVNFYHFCGLYYIFGQLLHLWLQSVHVSSRLIFFLSVVGDFFSRFVGSRRSPSNGASISHTSPWSQPFPE